MIFLVLSEFKARIAESDIFKIILCGRIDISFTLYIISFRLAYKEGIDEIIKIFF